MTDLKTVKYTDGSYVVMEPNDSLGNPIFDKETNGYHLEKAYIYYKQSYGFKNIILDSLNCPVKATLDLEGKILFALPTGDFIYEINQKDDYTYIHSRIIDNNEIETIRKWEQLGKLRFQQLSDTYNFEVEGKNHFEFYNIAKSQKAVSLTHKR